MTHPIAIPPIISSSPGASVHKTPGFVYFIQGQITGLIKIGWTISVEGRLFTLQASSPDKLKVLGWFPGNGREERALHKHFASCRSHGEWFFPEPELLAEVKRCAHRKHRKWRPASDLDGPRSMNRRLGFMKGTG